MSVNTNGEAHAVLAPAITAVTTVPVNMPDVSAEMLLVTGGETGLSIAPPQPVERPSALDQADRWVADVVRMRDALAEEESELATRLHRIRSTRERISQVVAIFEAPSAPSMATVAEPDRQERRRSPAPLNGRWSRDHAACTICGRTDRVHKGGGRCSACDSMHRKLAASKEQTV